MNRKDIDALRMNGYAVVDERIACRAGVEARPYDPNSWRNVDAGSERFADTHLVAIVVDILSGDGRAIVDAILASADSPRALVGRKRNGSAVLLFKCPAGMTGANRLEHYGTHSGVRFTLSIVSEGATLVTEAYDWPKNRSPLEVERDRLPSLTLDVPVLITEAIKAAGCVSQSMIEQARQDETDSARYATMKIPSAAEEAELADLDLVRRFEGQHLTQWDGPMAQDVIRARRVVAARAAAKAEAQI
jgi:hypothetical protein